MGPGSTGSSPRSSALREGGYPKVKVGHGGTLDPLASGVLPIALGEATKLSGRMLGADKQYEFTIAFGEETDTSTRVARSSRPGPAADASRGRSRAFCLHRPDRAGPPAYSALKVEGKRAYALARAEAVEMKPAR